MKRANESNWSKLKVKIQRTNENDGKKSFMQTNVSTEVVSINTQQQQNQVEISTEVKIEKFNIKKYIALDCEMVGLGEKGNQSALARCCLVDFNGHVVYDKFVQPRGFVTDFRTKWSGIRKADLNKDQAIPFIQVYLNKIMIIKND
jgi:hypothetical protein